MNKGFRRIEDAAIKHAGGKAALEKRLPKAKSSEALRALGDDRYLSMMSLRVFRAGLKHSLVDAKWPAFEEVFLGFEPRRVRAMSDEALEGLMGDSRLIRHWGKIKATRDNAAAMCRLIEEQGSFGSYLAAWPGERIVELWDDIAKRFSQMGGSSGPYFLRMVGKDTFLLTGDVVRALDQWRAFKGDPKAKKSRMAVQELFNDWAAETGRPLSQLSMMLALSLG